MPRYVTIIAYVAFIALGAYRWISGEGLMDVGTGLGIALLFDPFAPAPWPARPLWQRAWMIVHVIAVFSLIGIGWFMS
jgi:hypothetical protein